MPKNESTITRQDRLPDMAVGRAAVACGLARMGDRPLAEEYRSVAFTTRMGSDTHEGSTAPGVTAALAPSGQEWCY